MHYGIPYPRLHHAPQFPKRYVMDTPQMPHEPQHATGCAPEPPPSLHVDKGRPPWACTCSTNVVHAPSLARMCFFKPSRVAGQRTALESERSVSSVGQSIDQSHQVPVIQSFDQNLLDAGIRRSRTSWRLLRQGARR